MWHWKGFDTNSTFPHFDSGQTCDNQEVVQELLWVPIH